MIIRRVVHERSLRRRRAHILDWVNATGSLHLGLGEHPVVHECDWHFVRDGDTRIRVSAGVLLAAPENAFVSATDEWNLRNVPREMWWQILNAKRELLRQKTGG